jgi:tetraacyldisaccharide 4'-kinase
VYDCCAPAVAMIERDKKFMRAVWWLPAKLYELAVRLRVAAYETEYCKTRRLGAKVISVGNITLGGTGKTPLVEYIARYLQEEGYSVAILTRGYARKVRKLRALNCESKLAARSAGGQAYREFGDEPVMLARALPEIPILINADRYEAGQWAERELGAEVLVLDDGYQHLALARDLNILVLDATDPFGGFEMVPFGRLREPLYAIRRADAVIITRADRPFDQGQALAIIKQIKEAYGEKMPPVMYVCCSILQMRHLQTGAIYDIDQFAGWNAFVMCGIGNPQAFLEDVIQAGMNIAGERFFADHHAFTQKELDQVSCAAQSAGADMIVTTEKDAVRLEGLDCGEVPIYAARLKIQSEDEIRLKSLLLRALVKKRERE